jgi:hypothetical protein
VALRFSFCYWGGIGLDFRLVYRMIDFYAYMWGSSGISGLEDKGGQVQRTLNVLQPIVNHTHHHSNSATYYVSLVPSVLIISSEFYI